MRERVTSPAGAGAVSPNSSDSWLCCTPFGAAVDPDVYSRTASEAGDARAGSGRGPAGSASSASAPSGASAPRTISRSRPSSCRRSAIDDATSASRHRRAATTVLAPVSARTWASSPGVAAATRRTGTAPRAHRATATSVLAGPTAACSTTTSPGRTPARDRRAATSSARPCKVASRLSVCPAPRRDALADGQVLVPPGSPPPGPQGLPCLAWLNRRRWHCFPLLAGQGPVLARPAGRVAESLDQGRIKRQVEAGHVLLVLLERP